MSRATIEPDRVEHFLALPQAGPGKPAEVRLTLGRRCGQPTARLGRWEQGVNSGKWRQAEHVDIGLDQLDVLIAALRGMREEFEESRDRAERTAPARRSNVMARGDRPGRLG